MSKVAVVILNWNGLEFMKSFIPSVTESCSVLENSGCGWSARTVIADNGSTDGSVEWMNALGDEIQCIYFDKNYGFTGGYNKALALLEGYDCFVLLNSDIEVTPNWLIPLCEWMDSHKGCAVVCPKLKSYNMKDSFEYAGAAGGFIDRWGFPFCRGRIMDRVEKDNGQYDTPCRIFWASGAAMMVRTSVFRECGGLDERFFAHMEEIDFCWRVQKSGYTVWNIPQSQVYHVGGGTLSNDSPRKLYLNFRNNLLMLQKNHSGKFKAAFMFFRMLLDGAAACTYLIKGKPEYFKAVIEAHKAFRQMKPSLHTTPHRQGADVFGRWQGSIIIPMKPGLKRFVRHCQKSSLQQGP